MLAAIRGAEQRGRSGARKDNVGIDRINGEGPDGDLVHGRVQPLPMLAAVLAAVHAAVRATVHDMSVTGMRRQCFARRFRCKGRGGPAARCLHRRCCARCLVQGCLHRSWHFASWSLSFCYDAYPETPRAFRTASPIGTKGFSSGVVARNIRLWVMATASRVSGSAHPIDPPAPGWPKVRGFLPAATIYRGEAASPMLATRWKPPMLPLWGTPCT